VANLLLLPMAHRIRARVAERFEIQELMAEGVLCLVDGVHPSLMRLRLAAFLREPEPARAAGADGRVPLTTGANG
jgi:flagellar motor component MotA